MVFALELLHTVDRSTETEMFACLPTCGHEWQHHPSEDGTDGGGLPLPACTDINVIHTRHAGDGTENTIDRWNSLSHSLTRIRIRMCMYVPGI